jgi:GntR family transcriptional regulator of vanillate catabolism
VYQSLRESIVSGTLKPGTPLRPDTIADQLQVSTTPVREALLSLESDGALIKRPYQGWFVRDFSEEEAREMYELRASLECLSVRLACERITPEEVNRLRMHQVAGSAALASKNIHAYRLYNQDLHTAILQAARNSYLGSAMEQVSLQNQMLIARTIRITGRPSRALEEHARIIELIASRDSTTAEDLMRKHILSALEDVVQALGQVPHKAD